VQCVEALAGCDWWRLRNGYNNSCADHHDDVNDHVNDHVNVA
jgi:hypothetical protein